MVEKGAIMITETQYTEAVSKKDAAEKVIQQYHKESSEKFKARWERFDKHGEYFTDLELVYSSHARCDKCGAGMAYPKGCDPFHQWTCSNVLKGIGMDKGHQALPFTMYEVKSEDQPNANGATTRPKNEKPSP